jgi:hypothetical protein
MAEANRREGVGGTCTARYSTCSGRIQGMHVPRVRDPKPLFLDLQRIALSRDVPALQVVNLSRESLPFLDKKVGIGTSQPGR